MIRRISVFVFVALASFMQAQNVFKCTVLDSVTKETLVGATIAIKGTTHGVVTNANGYAELRNVPAGSVTLTFGLMGYRSTEKIFGFPMADTNTIVTIFLTPEGEAIEEIIVSSTRTNSRIDDLPEKVEVLGQEEMDEEASIVPGGIGSILGDLSVITIQKTNPVNGNDAVRMQGLDYKYTQLLRDGLPLYEGFSGSLGVLAIPPLDLKQVEIIKGSASTLYGGGAIGGLINFISKTPTDSPAVTAVLNQTTLNESNFNAFVSKKGKKVGTTLFAGATFKQAYDVNGDGFAEVPEQRHFIFHPRLFFYPAKKVNADLGFSVASDDRRGGDMNAIRFKEDTLHTFLFTEKVLRNTVDGHIQFDLSNKSFLTAKTTASLFDRSLYYAGFNFSGRQVSSYSELNHLFKSDKHTWVIGTNFITETFEKKLSDTVRFGNYDYNTIGLFTQENWQVFKKLAFEAGLRADHHNRYQWFILPRVGLFYKPADNFSLRMHYGSGYKTPNLFTTSQPGNYAQLLAIADSVKPELSNGLNMDINYRVKLGEVVLQLNQAFYYTDISNPTTLASDTLGRMFIRNAPYRVNSIGTDTYLRLSIDEVEIYLGYNHTEAKQLGTNIDYNMPFNPKDKFATTIAYEIEGKWRMGVEAAYNANQYIYNNTAVPNYWFFAAMIERKIKFGSIVLNCENIGDYRQSRYEALVTGTTKNPAFRSIWGPVEGRVINVSLKISL